MQTVNGLSNLLPECPGYVIILDEIQECPVFSIVYNT